LIIQKWSTYVVYGGGMGQPVSNRLRSIDSGLLAAQTKIDAPNQIHAVLLVEFIVRIGVQCIVTLFWQVIISPSVSRCRRSEIYDGVLLNSKHVTDRNHSYTAIALLDLVYGVYITPILPILTVRIYIKKILKIIQPRYSLETYTIRLHTSPATIPATFM